MTQGPKPILPPVTSPRSSPELRGDFGVKKNGPPAPRLCPARRSELRAWAPGVPERAPPTFNVD